MYTPFFCGLTKAYLRWILDMGRITDSGMHLTLRRVRAHPELPFQKCAPHYHAGRCLPAHSRDLPHALIRALKVYLPVHLLPLLLFRWRQLLAAPAPTLARSSRALLGSVLFLSSYQFVVKSVMCALRNSARADIWWHPCSAGLLTGLTTLLENPKRVTELGLYCAAHSLRACYRCEL